MYKHQFQFIKSEHVKASVPESVPILLQISAQRMLTLLSRPFARQRKSITCENLDFGLLTSAPITQTDRKLEPTSDAFYFW